MKLARLGVVRAQGFAFGAALLVPWLFIWQGLDFTDQGYLVTGYRCFFRHPEATEDSGTLWLTNFVGATWDALFGGLGLLGLRALWALCLSLGMLLAFRWVRTLTNEPAAAFTVLVTSAFLSDRRETWFSYNTFSSLLLVAAGVCLAIGIVRQHRWWLLGAGGVIGILPFARVPNVLALGLLSTLGLAALLDRDRRRTLLRDLGFSLAGVVGGVGATLLLIRALGHQQLFFRSLVGLFAPSMQKSGYSADNLLDGFVRDETKALGWGLAVCVVGLGLSWVLAKVPAVARWLLVAVFAAAGAWGLTRGDESWSFVVPGTSYWLLAAVALGLWKRTFELRVAAFIALIAVVIAPLGSNNGIKNAHMGLWLAVPLVLSALATLEAPWLSGQGAKLALIFGIALTGEALNQAASYTYRDAPRTALWTAVSHQPQLRGQYTTAARAQVVGEVLDALGQSVRPGDYLLAYEGTPLLQYLTKTRPYLNRPWLMGTESGDVVTQLAADAPRRTGCLPVAVLSLKSTRSADWPEQARRLEEREPQRGTRRALKAFLRAHGYHRKWSNSFFEILEPPSAGPGSCR